MAITNKSPSALDGNLTLRAAFNDADSSLTVGSFLVGQVGRKVTRVDTDGADLDGAAAGDDFSYYDDNGATYLYTIRILYSDAGKTILESAANVSIV